MNFEQMKRCIFGRQCNQVLIIDLENGVTSAIVNVIKALRETLGLTMSLAGPSRVPRFGLTLLGSIHETIFEMCPLIDHGQVLLNCLSNINEIDCGNIQGVHSQGEFLKTLYRISKDFNNDDITTKYNKCNEKVEITIISVFMDAALRECREFCRNSNTRNIQRIHIVVPKETDVHVGRSPTNVEINGIDEISVDEGVIEITEVKSNHTIVFEDIFKKWLLDNSLDSHHLEICVHIGDHSVIIKCDIQECIIQPNTLPQASSFMLETDYSVSRSISYANGNRQKIVPLYQMEILHRVNLDGVCESLIFGHPLLIKPTMCWKLDIEELTQSKLYFEELCKQLTETNSGLVLRKVSEDFVASFHLLIPADDYFLLKCLTSKELLLPREEYRPSSHTNEVVQLQIKDFLQVLKYTEDYNPIYYESGFCRANFPPNKRNKKNNQSLPKNFENKKLLSFGFKET